MWKAAIIWLATAATAVAQSYVDASVNLHGGSGTIIVRGERHAYGVSAAHVCSRVGKEFKFTCSDGKTWGKARWIARDENRDLALFTCWSRDTLAAAAVSRKRGPGTLTGCGFPGGKGPERLALSSEKPERITDRDGDTIDVATRDAFAISKGHFAGGNSGGGVFEGGLLVSVMSHGRDDEMVYGSSHADLMEFLSDAQPNATEPLLQEAGQWGDKDRTGQILELWKAIKELQGRPDPEPGPPGPPGVAGKDASAGDLQELRKQIAEQKAKLDKVLATPITVQVLDPATGKVIAERKYPFGTPVKLVLPSRQKD